MINVKSERKAMIEKASKTASEIIEEANGKLEEERAKMKTEINKQVEEKVKKVLEEVYAKYKIEIDKKVISEAIDKL